jgi:hypothetical protein
MVVNAQDILQWTETEWPMAALEASLGRLDDDDDDKDDENEDKHQQTQR